MRRRTFLLALASVTLAAPTSAQTNLLVNGGFENPVVTGGIDTWLSGQTIGSGWVVHSGQVETLPNSYQPFEGNQSLDLNGVAVGAIRQDVVTTIGSSYDLFFALAGNPFRATVKTMDIYWGAAGGPLSIVGSYSFNNAALGTNQYFMGWIQQTLNGLVATSTTSRLLLQSTTFASPDGGVFLDDFRLYEAEAEPPQGTVTPEPVTMTLLGTGLAGIAAARRRRRA